MVQIRHKVPFRSNNPNGIRYNELELLDKLTHNQESSLYGEAKNSIMIDEGIS